MKMDIGQVLLFEVNGYYAGTTIVFTYQYIAPSGQMLQGQYSMLTTGGGTTDRKAIPCPLGDLVSVMARDATMAIGTVGIVAKCSTGLTIGTTAYPMHVLFCGWTGGYSGPSWHRDTGQAPASAQAAAYPYHGDIPAVGNETGINYLAYPFEKDWVAVFTLTTSAAVANRIVTVTAAVDGVSMAYAESGTAHTAGTAKTYFVTSQAGLTLPTGWILLLVPAVPLPRQSNIATTTTDIDVGDQFGKMSLVGQALPWF